MTPFEPLEYTLLDGKAYLFRLTLGGLRRVKRSLGAASIQAAIQNDGLDASISILWESLIEKPGGMTEDQFADLLPPDFKAISELVSKLMNVDGVTASPLPPTQ